MRRRLIAASAVFAAAVWGCAVPAERRAHVVDEEEVPFELLDPNAPPALPATAGHTESVTLCFIRDGRLDPLERPLETPVTPLDAVRALASAPATGDSARTAVGDPLLIRDVVVTAGVARVDLDPSISALGSDAQLLAIAQIVCTVTARPGIGQVAFRVEGSPVDVPRGDGSLVAEAVSRDDYRALLP